METKSALHKLKRLRGTPMSVTSYFIGKIGLVLVTSLVQTALLLAFAAILFDVPMPSSASAWATCTWVFVSRPQPDRLPG